MKRLLAALCALIAVASPALAQTYPSKPIRLVVGYSPGGGNDLIARIVAAKLQSKLGQPVVVDNKPGAQSIVAAELVAKALVRPEGFSVGSDLILFRSNPFGLNAKIRDDNRK